MSANLGPVGPNDTILTTFGTVYEKTDAETGLTTATRVRVSLNPRETVHIDSSENKTMSLQCGDHAETLTVVDPDGFIEADAAE